MVPKLTPTSRTAHMARGKMTFERSKAEEKFTQALKADKKVVLEKEKVNQEKMAKLKALRLAKEASESA